MARSVSLVLTQELTRSPCMMESSCLARSSGLGFHGKLGSFSGCGTDRRDGSFEFPDTIHSHDSLGPTADGSFVDYGALYCYDSFIWIGVHGKLDSFSKSGAVVSGDSLRGCGTINVPGSF